MFVCWVFKLGGSWVIFPPSSLLIMSLSDQHPYTMFVAGGLRSPTLAKVQVDVGDNANAYLAGADVVSF